jgi:hypothetical protein
MTDWFRVTVEDLQTGDKQVIEVAEGDYVINAFEPCYLESRQTYLNGTVQVFIRDHRPADKPRHPESA